MEKQDFKLEDIKKMNLYEKMLHIEGEIGVVAKNLNVPVGGTSYKAVSEADVKMSVSPLEQKYRVKSIPVGIEVVESGTITSKRKYGDVDELWIRVRSTVKFINIDNPEEFVEVSAFGDGIDGGDKAPGKGDTYSVKYCYLKAYKIVTGDDPDKDPSEGIVTKGQGKAVKAEVKPKPKSTTTTSEKITAPQEKLIGVLQGKGKINKDLKPSEFDKKLASDLISKANSAKDDECFTVSNGKVVQEDTPF